MIMKNRDKPIGGFMCTVYGSREIIWQPSKRFVWYAIIPGFPPRLPPQRNLPSSQSQGSEKRGHEHRVLMPYLGSYCFGITVKNWDVICSVNLCIYQIISIIVWLANSVIPRQLVTYLYADQSVYIYSYLKKIAHPDTNFYDVVFSPARPYTKLCRL